MKNLLIISLLSSLCLLSACQSINSKPETLNIKSGAPKNNIHKPYMSTCLSQANKSSQQIKLGYGSGLTLNEAKRRAYKDIAEQLGVRIKTRSQTQVIKNQNDVTQNYRNQIDTFSQAEFDDLSIECLDKQDPSGSIHLLLGYDLRPLYLQIADKLVTVPDSAPGVVNFTGPDFLTQSKLAHDVKKTILKKNGRGAFNAEIRLKRHKDKWQWIVAGQPFFLDNNELHLAINWQALNKGSSKISAISTKGKTFAPLIKTETEFRLKITAKQKGYLHILGIYENGEIDVIRSDIKTREFQQHIVPEIPGVFEAGLINSNKAATDVYLVAITQNPLTETKLLPAGSSEPFYLMTTLNNLWLNQSEISTYLLTITPE